MPPNYFVPVVAALAGLAFARPVQAQVNFGAADVAANQIEYDYNTKDDLGYINSRSTGHNLLQSADTSNIVRDTEPPSPCLIPKTGATGPGTTCSVTWHFEMPPGYTISALRVGYRLTTFSAANPANLVQLSVSTDGIKFTPFASLKPREGPGDGTVMNDLQAFGGRLKDLTSSTAGKSQYYIRGEIIMGAYGESFPNQLQLFRADDTGAATATFTNTISLQPGAAIDLTRRAPSLCQSQL